MALFLSLEISQESIFFQHANFFVSLSALEPTALVNALPIQQDKAQALLIIIFVDLLADLTEINAEHFVATHKILFFFSLEFEFEKSLVWDGILFDRHLGLFFILCFSLLRLVLIFLFTFFVCLDGLIFLHVTTFIVRLPFAAV